jgi:AcrR family transcriptional regulator
MGADPNSSRIEGLLPRGPHRLSVEQVADNQRARLIEAMVELAGERGFAATPVADLIARAQVSRKTFYAHFANREDLLLVAFDSCATTNLERAREACSGSNTSGNSDTQTGLDRMIGHLCSCHDERPGTIAICNVEITASNGDGLKLRNDLMRSYGSMIQASLKVDGEAMSDDFARTLAGALHRTIDMSVSREKPASTDELSHELTRWAHAYRPFPSSLGSAGDSTPPTPPWPWLGGSGLVGGRAPGTLTLAPKGYLSRRGYVPSTLEQHTNRERMLDALTELNAEQGYLALTAEAIAARAGLPLGVFRAQFDGKDDAFIVALELGHMRGRAIVERARSDASNWAEGARAATYALLEFLASEPQFTKLALLDAPLAGSDIARRARENIAAYAHTLFEGVSWRRTLPKITPAACINGLLESSYPDTSQGHLSRDAVILSTFFVLAPFIGVANAAEMSAGGVPHI